MENRIIHTPKVDLLYQMIDLWNEREEENKIEIEFFEGLLVPIEITDVNKDIPKDIHLPTIFEIQLRTNEGMFHRWNKSLFIRDELTYMYPKMFREDIFDSISKLMIQDTILSGFGNHIRIAKEFKESRMR